MDKKQYEFLLDYFPLVDEICHQNPLLGASLQQAGWRFFFDSMPPEQEIETLLKLSFDLGYLSGEIEQFLVRQLKGITKKRTGLSH